MRRTIKFVICVALCSLLLTIPIHAHSGRTDSKGGHYNHSTGDYHYHHGYSAHDHYDMNGDGKADCPYTYSGSSSSSSSGKSNSGTGAGPYIFIVCLILFGIGGIIFVRNYGTNDNRTRSTNTTPTNRPTPPRPNHTALSNGLTHIRKRAFKESRVTSITIPNSVKSIGEEAFAYCLSLVSVTFEENSQLTSIGENAFSCCTHLASITIPDGVTSIGSGAFLHCDSLTSVTIPSSVTSIGSLTFADMGSKHMSITFDGTKEQWGKISRGHWWNCFTTITVYCADGKIVIDAAP